VNLKEDAVRVAVIGHTGMGGKAITEELVRRGHQVTGLARNADKAPQIDGLTNVGIDIFDPASLRDALRGHDVVVSAFAAGHDLSPDTFYRQAEGTRRIIGAFKESGAGYLLYIGGVASLYTEPGVQVYDSPGFPGTYFGTAPAPFLHWLGEITGVGLFHESAERRERGELGPRESDPVIVGVVDSWEAIPLLEGCRIALDLFAHRTDIDWSFLSPPWLYRPGKGSGSYHLGIDYVPMENGHPAGIDVPDLALAVCDETERRALIHRHWTVSGAQENF